jgi:TetR/AcrR family transcriptional repressor of nem operon
MVKGRPASANQPTRGPRSARGRDAQGTREALVLAAYRELAERGFEGLRTREIAGAVGVNVATLHYYFPHKQDLVRSVVGHAMSRFRTTLVASGSPGERLRAHFAGLRRLAREEPALFRVMGELALRSARDPAIATILRKMDDAWHATLGELIDAARRSGAIDERIDPDAMAALIVAALRGTYLLPAASAQPRRLDQTLGELERSLGVPAAVKRETRARTG